MKCRERKTLVISTRYTGNEPPPASTACKTCEGMGFHPTRCACEGTKKNHRPDKLPGWCFVAPCAACNGTRLARPQ